MHHPKLKYNQQKLIWMLMQQTCVFISISCYSCPILLRSLAHTFPCTTEGEGQSGVVCYCGQTSLITIHTHPWGVILENIESGYCPPSPPSAPALFTHKFCVWWNPSPAGGIHPAHHHCQRNTGVTLCDVGWMNDGSNRAYMTVFTPEKNPPYAAERQLLLGAWPSFFRGHNSSCSWIYIKATKRIQQKNLKIKILVLIWVYEYLLHRFVQQQPWVEKSPCYTFCVNCPICCSHIPHTIIKPITSPRP